MLMCPTCRVPRLLLPVCARVCRRTCRWPGRRECVHASRRAEGSRTMCYESLLAVALLYPARTAAESLPRTTASGRARAFTHAHAKCRICFEVHGRSVFFFVYLLPIILPSPHHFALICLPCTVDCLRGTIEAVAPGLAVLGAVCPGGLLHLRVSCAYITVAAA